MHAHELVRIFLSWTCRNFFAWLWKNLVVVYGYVKIFYFGGALNFFFIFYICVWWWGIGFENFFFFGMEIFGHVGFGHGN